MSWSFRSKGTKAGARAQLAAMKNYASPGSEEFKVSEGARATLLALIDGAATYDGQLTIVNAGAAGHGAAISAMDFALEYVWPDPAPPAAVAPPEPAPAAPEAPPAPPAPEAPAEPTPAAI